MDGPSLLLQEFFIEGKARDKSHVLLHITEPTTPKEKKVGYFFAVAEIEGGTIEHIEHIQTMIDDLESGVYETDSTADKTSFEATLEYINRRGHHILDFDGTCHILVGTIRDGVISFAFHGEPGAFLLFEDDNGSKELIDILEPEPVNTAQLFSAVLEGSIGEGDTFFVATPRVASLLGEKLGKVLGANAPKQTAATIDTLARSAGDGFSYGGIIATLPQGESAEEATPVVSASNSLDNLSTVQKRTRETVRGDVLPPKRGKRTARHTDEIPLGNQMLVMLGKGIVIVLRFIIRLLLWIVVMMKELFVNGFILLTNVGGQRQYVLDNVKRIIHERQYAFQRLPLLSKILFFATIVVAVVFVGSIMFLRAREAKEAELASYVNTVQAIRDKRDAAESSLIYDDTDRAFTLLEEARTMLAELPEKTEDEQLTKSNLTIDIEALLEDLRNVTMVEPETIVRLADVNQNVNTTRMIRVEDSIIIYGESDTNHYVLNMNTGETDVRSHETITPLLAADTPKEYDYVSFLTGATSLATLDPESFTVSEASIGSPIETTLVDLAIYNRRAYTLSPSTNQIYRHSPTQNGFDNGAAWLTTDTILSDATAITIDGDIYVLKSTGQILKFFAGEPEPFGVTGLDPALSSPSDIWTYTDVDYIYVLEPSQNRLVELNKDGSLSAQYSATVWNEPEAFVVNPETNEIFVLDDTVVYRFSTR